MKTTAKRVENGYVLDGIKSFITNAPVADLFLIYAVTGQGKGYFGISAFLIPAGTPGIRVVPEHDKTGLRTSPWGAVYLENCHVPASALVGREDRALRFSLSRWSGSEPACSLTTLAQWSGFSKSASNMSCMRKQFGRKLGEFQSVSNRIVDMKLRLEAGRLLLYQVGELHRAGKRCEDAVAMSKLLISEAAVQTGLDAIQIFGASGIATDTGVDALLRDAIPSRLFSGSSEIQRMTIARTLGVG